MSLTGLSYTTLTYSVWIAREFANTRRRVLLEWWPHRETAPLKPPDQDVVFDQVEAFVTDHWQQDERQKTSGRVTEFDG